MNAKRPYERIAITGAARGIGRAIAETFVAAGARVAIGGPRTDVIRNVAADLGNAAVGLPLDVRDPDSFTQFLNDAEERLGPLDVLVNNAGIAAFSPFAGEDPQVTAQMIDTNFVGAVTGTRLALQRFLPRRRGHIVNIASSSGQIATAGAATYAATKHAIVGFSRALRSELRGSGVGLTLVMPGLVRTDMLDGLVKPRATRVVSAQDVAEAVLRSVKQGHEEVFVPREIGALARFVAGSPPWLSDGVKRLVRADTVMIGGDRSRAFPIQ